MSCKHLLQRDAPGKAIFLVSCVLVILALPCRYLGEHQAETTMLILAAPMAWCYLLFFCRWVTISFVWWVKITKYTIQSNFQFDVERDLRLHWFCFTSFCDWVRKLTPLSPPVRCRTKTNDDLIARVFPHFSGPSLPLFTICSYWLYYSFSRLAVVITLVLVLRQSVEKRSIFDGEEFRWGGGCAPIFH